MWIWGVLDACIRCDKMGLREAARVRLKNAHRIDGTHRAMHRAAH